MTNSELLEAYLTAYNEKVRLQKDPLLEAGAIDVEAAKITGSVSINDIRSLDNTINKIETDLPSQIAQQTQIMENNKADIIAFFSGKHGLTDVTMDSGQKLSVSEGQIIVT